MLEMAEKTKINTPNGPKDAIDLEFKQKNDPWIVIEVEDGTTIRAKLMIDRIFRIEGAYDQVTGEPGYTIKSRSEFRIKAPTKLRKFISPSKKSTGQEIV